MKHLFSNYEGEVVAADTLDQAARFHDCELGGAADPEEGWSQIADTARIPFKEEEGDDPAETKTASEWAADYNEPTLVSTTYN